MSWPAIVVAFLGMIEAWPGSIDNYYQHRMFGEVRVRAEYQWIHAEAWMGLGIWGRPDAKIPSSFLNLEATRALERTYGASVTVGPPSMQLGATAYRRGVEETDRTRRWGVDSTMSGYRYSLGYHDGLRPLLVLTMPRWGVRAEGPWVWKYNDPLTLPAHDWQIAAHYWLLDALLAFGGTRGGVAADVGITQRMLGRLSLGVRAGWIELPGWGKDAFRAAAVIVAH